MDIIKFKHSECLTCHVDVSRVLVFTSFSRTWYYCTLGSALDDHSTGSSYDGDAIIFGLHQASVLSMNHVRCSTPITAAMQFR